MEELIIIGHLDCTQTKNHLPHCWEDDTSMEFFCNGLDS